MYWTWNSEISNLHKYSHPFCFDAPNGAQLLPVSFIILDMSLQLDWSPPVANSIVWTWFRKKHTCLYKVPQLTVHVRNYTMKSKELSIDIWDRILMRHISGEGYKTIAKVLNISKSTMVSIIGILKKKYGTTQTLPRADCATRLSNGAKGLGQGGGQEPDCHSDRAPEFLCGDERTFQRANHLCITPPIRPLW